MHGATVGTLLASGRMPHDALMHSSSDFKKLLRIQSFTPFEAKWFAS